MSTSYSIKRSTILILAIAIIFTTNIISKAAGNEVDLTFNAIPSKNITDNASGDLALQPDGKVIVVGSFQILNGVPKAKMARLNTDGSLDLTFNPAIDSLTSINSVLVQFDGKILIAGTPLGETQQIIRLNSDGSLDSSFTGAWTGSFNSSASLLAVLPDGRFYAARHFFGFHIATTSLYRLNSNGSVDSSFGASSFDGWNAKYYLTDLVVLPGGKVLVSGRHSNGAIFRLNSDGSKDTAFESPLLTSSMPQQFPPVVDSIAMQSDGKVLFTGQYVSVNGISRTGLTRLNADGTLDLAFPQVFYNDEVQVFSTDKILVDLVRLNADGSLDNTYMPPPNLSLRVSKIDSLDRVVFFGAFFEHSVNNFRFGRLAADGAVDMTFQTTTGLAGQVSALAVQPDGKILVSGDFSFMNGIGCNNIVRLNPNSSLDSMFGAALGFDSSPSMLRLQTDNKILAIGGFQSYNGIPRAQLARLNSDGSLDNGFAPATDGQTFTAAIQADQKILIGGLFGEVNGSIQRALARLNSNGSLDFAFNPLFGNGTSISAITLQTDGKIMVGGSFSGISGAARSNLARLNANGTVDLAFNAGSIPGIYEIVIQPDGKYLVAGLSTIRRLNNDGTLDSSFTQTTLGSGTIRSMLLQPDGSLVIGGSFPSINGTTRPNLARLTSNGGVDALFFSQGANAEVKDVVAQADGKLIVGGLFTVLDTTPRVGLARLNVSAFTRAAQFDYDGDGKADVSVFRASNNYWYLLNSSDGQFNYHFFGANGDIPAPGDYDGDGKTDLAIFRPSTGDWWYKSSVTGVFTGRHWGASGDVPRPTDFDGDGKTDFVVFRPNTNMWHRLSNATNQSSDRFFGSEGDKPLVGDFDGDKKGDPAIYRPATGVFWYLSSIDSVHRAIQWGNNTDIPVPADYDGDGKTDAAVYRASTGFWYLRSSIDGTYSYTNFGLSSDKPVPADYDGDGKADIAVYRPSTGYWYLLRSTTGLTSVPFGNSTDMPTPNSFVP
jgi:uncharacterized delta-60 repeat protein